MKVINNILCIMIVSVLLMHTNYVLIYSSLYEINVTALTQSCCEKIVINCNAHCYLDKKINETDNNTNGNAVEIKLKISEYVVNEYHPFLFTKKISKYIVSSNTPHPEPYCTVIEHPPK
ncbi:MAG: hypothetical protein M3P82_05900 [Bacteroidota bacterium]|nr:hypothetical protein [Bacteroidota bacterium]